MRKLDPVAAKQRMEFGEMNAGLTEAVTGIEVVKSAAQEAQERQKFLTAARAYRDRGRRARAGSRRGYLPTLLLGVRHRGGAAPRL